MKVRLFFFWFFLFFIFSSFRSPYEDAPQNYLLNIAKGNSSLKAGNLKQALSYYQLALNYSDNMPEALRPVLNELCRYIEKLFNARKWLFDSAQNYSKEFLHGYLKSIKNFYFESFPFEQDTELITFLKSIGILKNPRTQNPLNNMVFIKGREISVKVINGGLKMSRLIKIKDLYADEHEITNQEYCRFLNNKKISFENAKKYIGINSEFCKIDFDGNNYYVKEGYEKYPVLVSFSGAKAYAKWVNKRLPTYAEWFYIASEGENNIYEYTYKQLQNYEHININALQPVKTKKPNALSVYDIVGNALEWVEDTIFPPGTSALCGWKFGDSLKTFELSNYDIYDKKIITPYSGFRCVKDVE